MSSRQAVDKVKYLLSPLKIGHAGTLDPLASGVLPMALGEGTKLIEFIQGASKGYTFIIEWGKQTTTDDSEGEVIETSTHRPSLDDIKAILSQYTGTVMQRPPAYSAIKVNGQRAYKKARSGEDVELEERPIQILNLEHVQRHDDDHDEFKVECGKGTYIRSLGRDIALALSTVGHISLLRRDFVGQFCLKASISLEKLEEMMQSTPRELILTSFSDVLDDIPAVTLSDEEAQRLKHGQRLSFNNEHDFKRVEDLLTEEKVLVWDDNGPFAIARIDKGILKPMRLLNI